MSESVEQFGMSGAGTDSMSSRRDSLSIRPMLFEIAWEVCSQAGGIYTVLRSKAPAMTQDWHDDYWLIGPYREPSAQVEFEPEPPAGTMRQVIESLHQHGLIIHCGRWLISGRPLVALIDLKSFAGRLAEMKYFLWKDLHIETPPDDREIDETVLFGYASALLLQTIHEHLGSRPVLAHFHEWQAALALPILKQRQVRICTIFTTHATLVGRSLSANNINLYDHLQDINGEAVAHEYRIAPRFYIERAATQSADIFTTVSGITALEAEQFLQRKPEVLLPNGLNVERFSAPYQFQNLHRRNKYLIHEFIMGHFFPSYTFDLDQTIYVFTAGRYEYRNKGFEVFIEALYRLNQRLKLNPEGVTVVAFIIAPANYRSLNVQALNRQAMFHELHETCQTIKEEMGEKLFRTVAHGRLPTTDDLLDEFARIRLKRMMHAWAQSPPPMIVTHDLVDDGGDLILRHLRHRNLVNLAGDPVKVVFHPEFITSTSPILGLEYDQFVRGCHMGVFPSYYEPWGYTPMECVVRGIPTVTSDYSGFGAHVMSQFPEHDENGIAIARRRNVDIDMTIEDVANQLHTLVRMSRRDRIQLRNRVEAYAEHFDWNRMIEHYRRAHEMAIRKIYPENRVELPEPKANRGPRTVPKITPPKARRKRTPGDRSRRSNRAE